MMIDTLLSIENLTVEIKDKYSKETVKAVNDLSLKVYKGKTLGIIGESGSGKTVTSLSITGLQNKSTKIISGKAVFDNTDILKDKNRKRVLGDKISMIFQDPTSSLNPLMKIGKQVEENVKLHRSLGKKDVRRMALEAMEHSGLSNPAEIYNAYPHELSGGMKQRAMIASAIILKPLLIIADEPTTALDASTQSQIIDLFIRLKNENNMSMIFISHDFEVISHLSDYIAVMYKGYLLEYGEAEGLIKNPGHPYTKGLLKCIPSADKKGRPLYRIKEDTEEYEKGCPFAKRCEYAEAYCFDKLPELTDTGKGSVRCLRYGEI